MTASADKDGANEKQKCNKLFYSNHINWYYETDIHVKPEDVKDFFDYNNTLGIYTNILMLYTCQKVHFVLLYYQYLKFYRLTKLLI